MRGGNRCSGGQALHATVQDDSGRQPERPALYARHAARGRPGSVGCWPCLSACVIGAGSILYDFRRDHFTAIVTAAGLLWPAIVRTASADNNSAYGESILSRGFLDA